LRNPDYRLEFWETNLYIEIPVLCIGPTGPWGLGYFKKPKKLYRILELILADKPTFVKVSQFIIIF